MTDEQIKQWASEAGMHDPQDVTLGELRAALRSARDDCAMEVWYTLQDALAGADDLGVEGWLREAEARIRRKGAHTTQRRYWSSHGARRND